ncbi:hypothetical protein D3W54_14455 [Komagataeibacter medellinensis]|uniref:Uncharacterized protein n=1 Tax=Komagataeibacter medellinensis TaxID=1177712 RepID=A0ABQ6VSP4_9PROT|nr:hypothetical protein D3W54_14455 [Komagataeibacter medellinensis]
MNEHLWVPPFFSRAAPNVAFQQNFDHDPHGRREDAGDYGWPFVLEGVMGGQVPSRPARSEGQAM